MSGTTLALVVIVIAAVAVLVVIVVAMQRQRALRARFGPEYDRTVEDAGGKRAAVKELSSREQRHDELQIRELDETSRHGYAVRWREVQERFVDAPQLALLEADRLISEVMAARGYPVGDVDQQARDLSVEHADVVDQYREAHDIATDSDRSTEDQRSAMLHYRSLFAELVGIDQVGARSPEA